MSTTLKGVALGLSVPLVLGISGWAGWAALTANLPPAEISTIDESHREDVSNSLRSKVAAVPPQIEESPGVEQLRGGRRAPATFCLPPRRRDGGRAGECHRFCNNKACHDGTRGSIAAKT